MTPTEKKAKIMLWAANGDWEKVKTVMNQIIEKVPEASMGAKAIIGELEKIHPTPPVEVTNKKES